MRQKRVTHMQNTLSQHYLNVHRATLLSRKEPLFPRRESLALVPGNEVRHYRIISLSQPCPVLATDKINPVLVGARTPCHKTCPPLYIAHILFWAPEWSLKTAQILPRRRGAASRKQKTTMSPLSSIKTDFIN